MATDDKYCICPKCEGYGADRLSVFSMKRGSFSARRTAKKCTLCGGIGKIRTPNFAGLGAALDELRKPL